MILTGTGIIDSQRSSSSVLAWVAGAAPNSASSTNKISWSSDGINWIKGTITDNSNITNIYSVCFNGTIWVAVGTGTNKLMTSTDGKTWTTSNAFNTFFTQAWSVAWNGTFFLATGVRINTTGSAVAYSTNGTTWTGNGGTLLGSNTNQGYYVYWNGSRWYICGYYTSGVAIFKFATTTVSNGSSGWIGISNPSNFAYASGYGITYNGTTTTIATASIGVQTSPPQYGLGYSLTNPPTTFTTLTTLSQSFGAPIWSNYGPGRFIVPGIGTAGNTSIQFSQDGITWFNSTNSDSIFGNTTSAYPYKVAWNGTMYVAVAAGPYKVGYSYDGDTWYGSSNALGNVGHTAIASKTAPNLYPPLP